MSNRYWLNDDHSVRPAVDGDLREWCEWFEKNRRTVAREKIGDAEVSTVFLGWNHDFTGRGPPILFETMIFGGPRDQEDQWRYSTWNEALEGHQKVVEWVRSGYPKDDSLS